MSEGCDWVSVSPGEDLLRSSGWRTALEVAGRANLVCFQHPNICEQLEVGGGGEVGDYFLIFSFCNTFMYHSAAAKGSWMDAD